MQTPLTAATPKSTPSPSVSATASSTAIMSNLESVALRKHTIVPFAQSQSARPTPRPPRIPIPSHRHVTCSAPWEWLTLTGNAETSLDLDEHPPCCQFHGADCDLAACWTGYPRHFFDNWSARDEQIQGGIQSVVLPQSLHTGNCRIWQLDLMDNGVLQAQGFVDIGLDRDSQERAWDTLGQSRPQSTRVRALFIDHMSAPAVQMIGTMYKINPFFFDSSIQWRYSRLQGNMHPRGDQLTITLIFLGTKLKGIDSSYRAPARPKMTGTSKSEQLLVDVDDDEETENLDTQEPLEISSSNRLLYQDLLSVHLVRSQGNSTLVSYHSPQSHWYGTEARELHRRIHYVGRNQHWHSIFRDCGDPTFLLLPFLWHAVYSWDESQEVLELHICHLETLDIHISNIESTHWELHIIHAQALHYETLLDDLHNTILFIRDTPNPARELFSGSPDTSSTPVFLEECNRLLSEVERLKETLDAHNARLQNLINLTLSLVNINHCHRMGELAQTSATDNTVMCQIAYLTTAFLPASFIAGVFGMNVQEINEGSLPSLRLYLTLVFPLTLATIWIAVALQIRADILQEKEQRARGIGSAPRWFDEYELSPCSAPRHHHRHLNSFSIAPSLQTLIPISHTFQSLNFTLIPMDFIKKFTENSGSSDGQKKEDGDGVNVMGLLNNVMGGGKKGENKEDGLDKAVDYVQEHVFKQGDQSNESAVEQAKDEAISDAIRDQYKKMTGKDFPIADKS
ncbi:hypothetical protein ONZ45_g2413 [Pleurotus djamor]|nr:hypothetical protein ONZ45_g2413 [Pleurotus djamor]